jgi:hypothetical protein
MKKAIKARGLAVFLAAFAITSLSACKGGGLFNGKLFKERASEKPAPSDEGIEKSFFVNADGKPKTFLCAVAPEVARGNDSEEAFTLFANDTAHCNVEFEITENYLVGKIIQPSFLNDRARWMTLVKIPIRSHYYYERQKDAHGRETNEWIENTARSHWSARPMMKLDLSGLEMGNFGGRSAMSGLKATSVEDIEWDRQNNFLGFSINMLQDSEYQARFRVNFLKFEHDPSFQKVPYNLANTRYMNILHVLGRKIEGMEQELYAGHWDLRKPHTIYLNGVPGEIEPIIRQAVEKWNVALREIGAIGKNQTAFNVEVRNSKHPFDLRYPAINWISDRRISAHAPLGIGMAHADVRNGKIIWGGITLWGGALETYINHYTPIEAIGAGMVSGMTPFQSFAPLIKSKFNGLDPRDVQPGALSWLMNNIAADTGIAPQDPRLNAISADLINAIREENQAVKQTFADTTPLQMLAQRLSEDPQMNGAREQMKAKPYLAKALREKDLSRRAQILKGLNNINNSASFVETELTAANMSGSWMASPAQRSRAYPEMLESVVMELVLHEFGHMLGLGHQFKENIVPAEGTVPKHFVTELRKKATEEAGFTNSTSVMGYRNGRVEMITPAQNLNPGPHDKLVLRYLYRGQYSLYDNKADDFVYAQIPASGTIPERSVVNGRILPASYFPQCNDFEASLGADPFCNRWDKGTTAQDIMKSHFEYLSDNLLASLYNVVGGGGSPWYYEQRMWNMALSHFSRVRLFYDEMRRRLRSEPELVPIWDRLRQDVDSLFEFSTACMKKHPTDPNEVKSEILRALFKHEDIVDLCRANKMALTELEFFMNLPDGDYTKIDHKNQYVSSGYLEGDVSRDRSFDNLLGHWYQLSNFPLKFSALYTLSAADPFRFDPDYGLTPNYYFNSPENRYLYRSLYPREYTRLISSSVQNNMRLTATGRSPHNTIGKTILAMSSLLPRQKRVSNEAIRFPSEYMKMLDQQTHFDISMATILITPQTPDASSGVKADHYKTFSAKIYDAFSGSKAEATEVYVMPKGHVLVWAPGMFLFPITTMKFLDKNQLEAIVIAYKVSYDSQEDDRLDKDSVKYAIGDKYSEILKNCIEGFQGNGLRGFFANTSAKDPACANDKEDDFQGFYIPPANSEGSAKEKIKLFHESIDREFAKFEHRSGVCKKIPPRFPIKSMRAICEEAASGVGVISSTAALLNGLWFDIAADRMEK